MHYTAQVRELKGLQGVMNMDVLGYRHGDDNEQTLRLFNNGVYRAGFAASQEAYEAAFADIFTALDRMECILDDSFEIRQ